MTVAYLLTLKGADGKIPEGASTQLICFGSLADVNAALQDVYGRRKDWPWEIRWIGSGSWAIRDIAERTRGYVLKRDALPGEYVWRRGEHPVLPPEVGF